MAASARLGAQPQMQQAQQMQWQKVQEMVVQKFIEKIE